MSGEAPAAVVIFAEAFYVLTAQSSAVNEGDVATFTLVTDNVPDGTFLAYSVSGVSAADVSGGQLSGKVTISGGKSSISVGLLNDKLTEGNEAMTVSIVGTSASASVKVIDTSLTPAAPNYKLSPQSSSVNEGESAVFTLFTSDVADGTVLVYEVSGVSAADVSGGQLVGKASVFKNQASISIPLLNDDLTEGNEALTLSISGTSASASVKVIDTSLSPPEATYSLKAPGSVNEGETASFTLITTNVPDGTVLPYSVSGLSSADITGGQMSGKVSVSGNKALISVTVLADNLTEGNEELVLSIPGTPASATVKVIDTSLTIPPSTYALKGPTSINEGETAGFTLLTTNVPDGTVLAYSVSGVSAADISGGQMTGKVSVTGNKAPINISLVSDNLTEGIEELVLSITGTPASASVKVMDTSIEIPQATYSLTALSPSVNEGDTASFTLVTTQVPDGTVLGYELSGVSAADIGGGQLSGKATVIGNQASISVPLLSDSLTEGNESLVLSITGTQASASVKVVDTSLSPSVVSYTMPGTQAKDYFVLAANNQYLGGAGNDVYLINPFTLNRQLTATIVDTEGANAIQLTDGTIVGASTFLGNAVQLTLSTGAVLQILGASSFSFQLGANAIAGDASGVLSYAQLANAFGTDLPTSGSGSATGTANFVVPSVYTAALPTVPAAAGPSTNVAGTMGDDYFVVATGDTYFGGSGNDSYLVGGATFAGDVTAVIMDVEGSNTIQLVDGTTIASSMFLNDAVQLTLSTGARVQLPGASKFSIQVGANISAGDTAVSSSFAQFGSLLGAAIPAAGAPAVNGTANYLVPSSGGGAGGGFADGSTAAEITLAGVLNSA